MNGFTSIVVGCDFTPCSAVALGQAIRISGWSGASVHVVHVIDTLVVIELEEALSPMQEGIRDGLVRDAEKAWKEFAKGVSVSRGASGRAEGLPIEVSINNRIFGILKRMRENHADLLVLGAFGDRAPDVGVGTVATACVRKNTTDVLLVRDTQGSTTPFKTIVAAVDFSPTSLRALERAALFAARDGAELHVLHVFAAPWHKLHYRAAAPLAPPHLQKQYRDGLERRLSDFCRPALESNASLRTRFVLHDYSGHRSGIVEYAASVSADLIVLGTRGRTNIRDILLGSTAEKALEESRCSILAVKPEGFQHPLAVDVELQIVTMRPAF
jgi:universal stress protein E